MRWRVVADIRAVEALRQESAGKRWGNVIRYIFCTSPGARSTVGPRPQTSGPSWSSHSRPWAQRWSSQNERSHRRSVAVGRRAVPIPIHGTCDATAGTRSLPRFQPYTPGYGGNSGTGTFKPSCSCLWRLCDDPEGSFVPPENPYLARKWLTQGVPRLQSP